MEIFETTMYADSLFGLVSGAAGGAVAFGLGQG